MEQNLQNQEPQIVDQQLDEQNDYIKAQNKSYFTFKETIKDDESQILEFKNYYQPFNQDKIKILINTICAFLNSIGGTILIGINDTQQVYGIYLTEEQKNDLQMQLLLEIQKQIHPIIDQNNQDREVTIKFVPVCTDYENQKWEKGLWVVNISVKQGNMLNQLYSIKKGQSQMISYLRYDRINKSIDIIQQQKLITERAIHPVQKNDAVVNICQPDILGVKECAQNGQDLKPKKQQQY